MKGRGAIVEAILVVTFVGVAVVIIAICITWFITPPVLFSPYQPVAEIQADYKRCKANAPKGFDCAMVPMLVSEDFLKGAQ